VIEILAQEIDEVNISSTKIRNAIEQGKIEIANRYLGESFELNGIVVKGNQLGRTIGFPTANIFIDSDIKIIPKTGVYAVEIELPNSASLIGMLNIGVRPTLGDQLSPSIEVNIFDFKGDIYDSKIKVRFLSHIREEIKFNSLDDLKTQLHKDEKISREFASFAHK